MDAGFGLSSWSAANKGNKWLLIMYCGEARWMYWCPRGALQLKQWHSSLSWTGFFFSVKETTEGLVMNCVTENYDLINVGYHSLFRWSLLIPASIVTRLCGLCGGVWGQEERDKWASWRREKKTRGVKARIKCVRRGVKIKTWWGGSRGNSYCADHYITPTLIDTLLSPSSRWTGKLWDL